MQAIGGLLLIALAATALVLGQQWYNTKHVVETADATTNGFQTLIEVLYAYRLENPTQWPSSVLDLSSYVAPGVLHSASSLGTNGEGTPYSFQLTGKNVELSTVLTNEAAAARVWQSFGTRATKSPESDGYRISLTLTPPGGVTLLNHALLIDGSNKLNRPLWFSTHESSFTRCSGTGIAVDVDGQLLGCRSGIWRYL